MVQLILLLVDFLVSVKILKEAIDVIMTKDIVMFTSVQLKLIN